MSEVLSEAFLKSSNFCFHLLLFEYVVSLDKALYFVITNIIIVLFLILIFVGNFCLYTEESTVYK